MPAMPDQEPQPRDAASELASFGEELRREREIRGISLKEIADATKISKRFLDALERNDHKTLPAPVFTRGFVREYARYVGLNVEDMVNRYNFAASNDDRIEKPPDVPKYSAPPKDISPRPAPKRGIPPAITRVDRGVIWAVVIAAALASVAYWAVQYKQERDRAEAAANVPVTTRAASAPAVATPPPAAKPDDSKLHMTIVATAASWLEVEADGKTVYHDTIQPGARQELEATEQFRFRIIGNAGGLSLTLNGTAVPPLGGDGEVVGNRIYDRDALAKLRAEPQAGQ
jgi:transcriptional regulator with XRE-family HTH domain